MASPFAGGTIGKYRMIEQLGHGMSIVFKAVNIDDYREAVLKLIHLGNPDGLEKAEAEQRGAELQARLSAIGASVPKVYDIAKENGYFYVAMEFIAGEDLSAIIKRSYIDAHRATEIAIDICEFLEKAHAFNNPIDGKQAQGIIHGDLKPGNIRITTQGRAVIIDLGIAKALSGKSTKNDFASIAYSSPERLKTGKVNSLSDLWSIGIVLYEMVTGERPFNASDTESLEREIKSSMLIHVPSNYNLPFPLQRIIMKALAPNLKMRYATATAFKEDLQRFQSGTETEAEKDDEDDYEFPTERFDEPPTERTNGPRIDFQGWSEPDTEATKRTSTPVAKTQPDLKTKPIEQVSKPSFVRIVKRIVSVGIVLTALAFLINEFLVLSRATQLKSELISEQLKNLDDAWTRFGELEDRSFLRFGPIPARQPLKEKLVAQADRVFNDYRNHGSPGVKEKDWEAAQRHISRAIEIDSNDNSIKSKQRYAEGHIHRINGMTRLKSNRQEAKSRFNKAVNLFLEATTLNPQWPDPHIALASVYAYDLHDPVKVAGEIDKLKSLKVSTGNRETAMLADAYLNNGGDLYSTVDDVRQCQQKIEILKKSRAEYAQAVELYNTIVTFGNAAGQLNQAQRRIEKIDQMVETLRGECQPQ